MLDYIILGIIQGFTEFLPVSSSGHLVIMQKLLRVSGNEVAISVILHLGTLLSLIIFFFKDILKLLGDRKLLTLVIIVTAVTGTIGLLAKDFFEQFFSSPRAVAFALVATGIILLLTKKFAEAKRKDLKIEDALVLGLAQGIAIIPGLSRSGVTISSLLFRKIDRDTCFKFSFVASVPAILGAAILKAKDINFTFQLEPKNFIVGFIFSFFAGILALRLLKIILHKAKFHYFAYYCFLVAAATLFFIK